MPRAGNRIHTGAGRQRPAPVCVWTLLLAAATAFAIPQTGTAGCGTERIDERSRVAAVIDGDTIVLGDGRHLRLIGLNTPELGRDGKAPEPGAIAARDQLRALIFTNRQQVDLRFDQERQDHYGRLLAHAFVADGRNITEQLLRAGAGSQLVVPPNTWQVSCYQAAVNDARRQRKGIWALDEYRPIPADQLGLRSEGFHLVRGRISHVSADTRAVWLNFVGNFAAHIDRHDLANFTDINPEKLSGAEIEVQGWVQARKGRLSLRLRHPTALKIIAQPVVSSDLPSTKSSPVE